MELSKNTRQSGDYVVVKFSRWAFEKFKGVQDKLGTQMRAVGEVMSIGKTYKEAFQKSIRSLENGRYGLGFAKDFNKKPLSELMEMLRDPTSERQFIMYEALRKGADIQALYEKTYIKPYFIQQMKDLVELEEEILKYKGKQIPDKLLTKAKKDGFSDKYLAQILNTKEENIRKQRTGLGIVEGWHAVPVSGVENAAYYYSSYNAPDTVAVSKKKKIMVLGGGPNRIGQGIEFDYCCVHAAFALRDLGYETIMINCNPETVSTDYDTSDKLYFRAFDSRRCPEHLRKGKTNRCYLPVRRTDAFEYRSGTRKGRCKNSRHFGREYRPCRGPRQVQRKNGKAWYPDAGFRYGKYV